ncbi:MAG: phospholipase D-like domain-containing protein, partial [Coraliomargarita sp.]
DAVHTQHQIFDTILSEIQQAEEFVIADFFLWNPWLGGLEGASDLRNLSSELAEALIAKRIQKPDMPIVVLTDPINRIYGEQLAEPLAALIEAGVSVVFTDLTKLPDSNRLYSAQADFWGQYFDLSEVPALPNPFDSEGELLSLTEFSRLLYFKANHRKVLVTKRKGEEPRLLIGSLNPADGSANHSNLGLLVDGAVASFAAQSELELVAWSSAGDRVVEQQIETIRKCLPSLAHAPVGVGGKSTAAWRSEGAVRDEIVRQLARAGKNTRIDIALFYLSERTVIKALSEASSRGAVIRILLDANRDAFGREKTGVPNRPVAAELVEAGCEVRWAATAGEQFHSKVMRIRDTREDLLFLGSANWTRRNIGNYNLEANILLESAGSVGGEFDRYFESIWSNSAGVIESLPYEEFADESALKKWRYRFQEWSGLSTF